MPLDLVLEDGEKKEVKMEDTSNNEDSDDCTQHNGTSPKVSVTDFQTSSKVVGFNFFYVNAKKCVLVYSRFLLICMYTLLFIKINVQARISNYNLSWCRLVASYDRREKICAIYSACFACSARYFQYFRMQYYKI